MGLLRSLWMLLLVTGLLLPVGVSQTGKFSVHGSSGPVLSLLGEDVILPCRIIPESKPENVEITWAISERNIHSFQEGQSPEETRLGRRTELFKQEFSHGNVSLKLKNVEVSDQAKYTCTVKSHTWYDDTVIELQVAGLGRTPLISVYGTHENGIKLICKSEEWYPEPKVQWTGENGEDLTKESKTQWKKRDTGAFDVHSSIIIRPHSKNAHSCILQNALLKEDKKSSVMVSDEFYPRVSPWLILFFILLIIVVSSLAVALWKYREFTKKPDELEKQKTTFLEESHSLMCEIGSNKTTQQAAITEKKNMLDVYRNELYYVNCRSYADDFKLDKTKSHQDLILSEDGKSVKHCGNTQYPETPEGKEFYAFALVSSAYDKGKHYWEVDVGKSTEWVLGVTKELKTYNEMILPRPENGQWVLQFKNTKGIHALQNEHDTIPINEINGKLGIYLDCEDGEVSFIDVVSKQNFYTFHAQFSGKVYPVFGPSRKDSDTSELKICPVKH